VVTFTGGPFNTDMAQNSITAWGEPFEVLTVTSTQITARPGPNMDTAVPGLQQRDHHQRQRSGHHPYVYWKRPFNLMFLEDNLDDYLRCTGPTWRSIRRPMHQRHGIRYVR
jgi:hypothetical protein